MLQLLLLPLIEFFGRMALTLGLKALEKKYPGSKVIFDQIIEWLAEQASNGNQQATKVLQDHVDKICTGAGCPADILPPT